MIDFSSNDRRIFLSADDVSLLLHFQAMDNDGDRETENADLEMWVHRLRKEASGPALDAFKKYTSSPYAHPDHYPWSAVRVVEVGQPSDGPPVVQATKRAPPALFLIAARKPGLSPLRAGDRVSPVEADDPEWRSLWAALTQWDPTTLKARISPTGWTRSQSGSDFQVPPDEDIGPVIIDPIVIDRPAPPDDDEPADDEPSEPTDEPTGEPDDATDEVPDEPDNSTDEPDDGASSDGATGDGAAPVPWWKNKQVLGVGGGIAAFGLGVYFVTRLATGDKDG